MQKKLVVLFLIVLLAFVGLSARLILINKENGENYKRKILSQQSYDSRVLPFKRGDILDAQGSKLAYSEKVYNLIIDSKLMLQAKTALEPTLAALDACFDVDVDEIRNYINEHPASQYYVVAKQLTYDEIAPFVEMQNNKKDYPDITGVWFEEEYRRVYPYGTLACDVIGFTTADNMGAFGMEQYYNDVLNGTNGREYGYLTEDSNLERSTRSAEDGKILVSTIDANIQGIVEKYIAQWNHEHEGANAYRAGQLGSYNTGVIVMDPRNGEVLAMAGYPVFDLNDPRSLSGNGLYTEEQIAAMDDEAYYAALNSLWRNYCISDTYEPGSTAKTLTIAAALDSGAISGTESYYCGGVYEVSGHQIHCNKRIGHGMLTVSGSLEQSCNVALMQIGEAMGRSTFMEYLSNYNMGLKTNIDLAGEARTDTLIYDPETMVASDLAISTFGQGYNVTMIQMASAFCSIINGGYYYQPHVVKEIRNPDGTTIERVEPRVLKQTVSETTSAQMREYLARVCVDGTGTLAVPAGYYIGGKTGTAEMYPRKQGNYVVSFIGFAPIDDPQVVIYVVIDRPNVEDQPHSNFAQEITKNILTEILPYLQIFRTGELSEADEEYLKNLGILPKDVVAEEGETVGEGEGEPEEGTAAPVGQVDPATGYATDPNTGEALNPSTYAPVDPYSSDLDGIGAVVDEDANPLPQGEGGE
ncbi:MAG: hypothetical protein J1E61_09690 [Lachnospiraceae bacterium]|nr:hypothetical protein [Lachnospiraceae bacterium]